MLNTQGVCQSSQDVADAEPESLAEDDEKELPVVHPARCSKISWILIYDDREFYWESLNLAMEICYIQHIYIYDKIFLEIC